MRRLFPDPGPAEPDALISDALLDAPRPAGRSYTVANFVASVDGRASLDGGSTGLGDAGDKAIFRALRGCVDAVLVGTGTLAAEHYGPLARDPTVAELRARLRLAPQPPLVTITRSGQIPAIPLLDDPDSTLIVYAGAAPQPDPGDVAATVHVVLREPAELTTAAVVADLRSSHGIGLLLCEGGPSILGDLVAEAVLDELFLTLAPTLAGGDGGPITARFTPAEPLGLALAWALEQDGSLYLRYRLTAPAGR